MLKILIPVIIVAIIAMAILVIHKRESKGAKAKRLEQQNHELHKILDAVKVMSYAEYNVTGNVFALLEKIMIADVVKSFDIPGEFGFLSNFHTGNPFKINMNNKDVSFLTGEHAFQAYKAFAMRDAPYEFQDGIVSNIAGLSTPALAKKIGRAVKIDPVKWDSMKDECMRKVVFAKFSQNDDLIIKLIKTGTAMLVEGNTWGDLYWGRVGGKGLNRLGVILMEVRGYFFHSRSMSPLTEHTTNILMGW